MSCIAGSVAFFFFNDPATTEIYTLSLHDALPIWNGARFRRLISWTVCAASSLPVPDSPTDRKSTRLNSSHRCISYAVFCLKKKKLYDRKVRLKTVIDTTPRE